MFTNGTVHTWRQSHVGKGLNIDNHTTHSLPPAYEGRYCFHIPGPGGGGGVPITGPGGGGITPFQVWMGVPHPRSRWGYPNSGPGGGTPSSPGQGVPQDCMEYPTVRDWMGYTLHPGLDGVSPPIQE